MGWLTVSTRLMRRSVVGGGGEIKGEMFGGLWWCLGVYGGVWGFMVVFGSLWWSLGVYGGVWGFMVGFESLW